MAVPGNTLVEIFLNRIAKTPDLVAMRHKEDGQWKPITFKEFGEAAKEVGNGLISLGVEARECVSLLSANRPEWHIADAGTTLTGGCLVPVYVTNSPPQVAYVVSHSDSKVAIVENQDQLDKVLKVREELPKLQKVVVISGEGTGEDGFVISFDELRELGREFAAKNPGALQERIEGVEPEDMATIVYTSGTTGPPKGAVLTHRNFAWTLQSIGSVLPFQDGTDRVLSYLPLSHIFERLTSDWGGIHNGVEVWFNEEIPKLKENLEECRPTFFIGVPRVYEKFYMGLQKVIETHPKKDLIRKALAAATEKVELDQAGKPVPLGLRLKTAVYDRLVISKLRHGLGMDNVRFAITGAAPINDDILTFLFALGINVLEGYGQTEDNAPTSVNPPDKPKIGTVGKPIPGLDVKIDEDGEILVKGPNVFKGYFKDEDATKEALTEEGYLRTGDIGEFDDEGYLKITDRKKDLIITAGGKNISPQEIEGKLKFAPLISQAVVIGDRRPFLTALLTLDPEVAPTWAKEQGIEFTDVGELSENDQVKAAVEKIVEEVNSGLAQVESIKKWTLLHRDFTQEAEEITPTMKVKRKTINEKYGDTIERMYS